MSELRYPVGPCTPEASLTDARRRDCIDQIAEAPARLRAAVAGLSPEQLETPYRPGGWTVRQLVHHVPDSHMNAYVRCKLALTEDEPAIKTYEQERWAELADGRIAPPEVSLALLSALHERWVILLRALLPADFARLLRHPDMGTMTIDALVTYYAWHGRHHVAHITALRERSGWGQGA